MSLIGIKRLITILQNENCRCMAGHSKWANIKHIKALKDGQKAALFTRMSRQIRLSIQEGGSSDPNFNSMLRNIIEIALRKNMPMATIKNAIKKCEQSNAKLQKFYLEMRAMNKIFMICSCYTENLSGLKINIAPILRKNGVVFEGTKHMFDENGIIETKVSNVLKNSSIEKLDEICTNDAIECGAEEIDIVDQNNGFVNFLCRPIDLTLISKLLKDKGYEIENAEHVYRPKTYITVPDQLLKQYSIFLEKLKNVDGIDEVYDNLDESEL